MEISLLPRNGIGRRIIIPKEENGLGSEKIVKVLKTNFMDLDKLKVVGHVVPLKDDFPRP